VKTFLGSFPKALNIPIPKSVGSAQFAGTRRYTTADSLAYLSIEGLLKNVPNPGLFCTACFNNVYPINFPGQESQLELLF
jgi:amidophosphoribosyltransferase